MVYVCSFKHIFIIRKIKEKNKLPQKGSNLQLPLQKRTSCQLDHRAILWKEMDLNHRRLDFQSNALPLSYLSIGVLGGTRTLLLRHHKPALRPLQPLTQWVSRDSNPTRRDVYSIGQHPFITHNPLHFVPAHDTRRSSKTCCGEEGN